MCCDSVFGRFAINYNYYACSVAVESLLRLIIFPYVSEHHAVGENYLNDK